MRLLLVGVLFAGCGRFDFDPLPDPITPATVVMVTPQVPSLGVTWMLGVDRGTDVPCSYTSDFYDGCEHAAERLRVRVADDTTDCASLTIADDLGAFDWSCGRDGGELVFESQGLNAVAGLAMLVDGSGWKPNRFVAREATVERFVSEPAVWWDNPVVPLPDNSISGAVVTLADPRTIYTLASSRATAGYTIAADTIAIVLLDGAVLSYANGPLNCGGSMTADERCLITAMTQRTGLWIEGELDGRGTAGTSNHGVLLYAPQWSTLRHVHAHHHAGAGVYVEYAQAMLLFDYVATHNVGDGFSDVSSNVTARHVVVARNAGAGFYARSYGVHLLVDVRSYNNNDGIRFAFDAIGIFADILVAHNEGAGFDWGDAYTGGSLHAVTSISNASVGVNVEQLFGGTLNRIVSVNNGGSGLRLISDATNELAQVVAAHNALNGIEMSASDDNLFVANLLLGNNSGGQCSVVGGVNPGIDSACARNPLIGPPTRLGIDLTASFVGALSTQNETTLADWTLPSHDQVWGADSGTVFGARGRCQVGTTCRQWDFALAMSDAVLRDAADLGVPSPEQIVPGAICPAAAHGDVELSNVTEQCVPDFPAPCPRTYLLNALEILDDHVGNDDGYCESFERCMYLPHMSNHAGRGAIVGPCVFQDGTDATSVSGVQMFGYGE